ncbi:MFS transporter [Mycobacterium sp. MS1601]|uniref:MFS transporter n=1 Tax=Mycobacterium sp. MS1601 TaxID=1936029 RepID=UPI0009F8F7F1|nr:MFS transporter [Mycobacterium sp. MS1601]
MLGATLPTPMYELYSDRMQFSVLTTTVIFATYAGAVLAALLLFGRWSDVIGRRPVLLVGIGFAAASSVVFLVADSVPVLLVGRVLSGLSAGIFTGTATAAIIEAAPQHWKSRAAAVATVANLGGLGLGPLVAGLLVQYAPAPLHLSFAIHLALVAVAAAAVWLAPETSERSGQLGIQRLSVPPQTRAVFVVAATAAFAGFAVNAMFASVSPTFVAELMGISNHAVGGAVAGLMVLTAAATQPFAVRVPPARAVAVGSAMLVVAMVMLNIALHYTSLAGLMAAAVMGGAGQGLSFGRGLAAISERTPADRRAEVSSSYFLVAYVALSVPVIGMGAAAQKWGLQTAGEVFAVIVGVLAVICLAAILRLERRAQ